MTVLIDPEPTDKELKFFQHIYQIATRILSHEGHLDPVAFFRAGNHPKMAGMPPGLIVPVQMQMPDSDCGKDAMAEALRHLVKQTDAELVLMVLESWMVQPTPEEAAYFQREGRFQVRPSQHPNRIEIVLFSLSKSNGDSWSCWVQISRDSSNRPSIPSTPPTLEYLKSGGRFGNLFAEAELNDVPLGGMTNGPAATSNN